MSTERRRSGGRRARGPAAGERGNDSRGRAAGRDGHEDGGFWEEERPRRRTEAREGASRGGRRRARPERDSGGRRRASAHTGRGGRRRGGDDGPDERGWFKRFCARAWKPFLVVSGVGFVAFVALFGVAYAMTPGAGELDAQADVEDAATVLSYADGDEITTMGETSRVPVEREQIPQSVIDGVLAAEHRTFYEDPPISPSGMLRAALSGGQKGGGSTITQQMARNYYDSLSRDRSYLRKAKEILIALKVGQTLSHDQILTRYLNTIYFGRQASGVQAAAQEYFGKNVEDLNSAEGAFIGAIIQQPGNFENTKPDTEMRAVLKDRWNYVVKGLVTMHEENPDRGLSQAEAEKLEFPGQIPYDPGGDYAETGYIQQAVKTELRERYDLEDVQIAQGGLKVETSLDPELMAAADEAVATIVPDDTPEETDFGLAAVEPSTGEIRAFHGGKHPAEEPNNSLTQWGQAGSSFKPYVLATGLKQGIGLRSTLDGDSPKTFEGVGEPIQNNNNVSYGEVDLIESTANSINTSYVQLATEVTPSAVVETAKDAGIPQASIDTADLGPNIALGTYQVTAASQASGFATFANDGVHIPKHMITKVTDAEGNELEPNDAEELQTGTRAFDAEIARDATYAMTQVVENGGAPDAALSDGRPVAGKTGTSNDAVSAWFVGFTPQLSTAVGIHRNDNEPVTIPGVGELYGSTVPLDIWRHFMENAMEGEEVMDFAPPAYVGEEQNFMPSPSPSPSESETRESEEPEEPEESEEPEPTPSSSEDHPGEGCQPFEFDCEEESEEPSATPSDPSEEPGPGHGGGDGNGNGGDDDYDGGDGGNSIGIG